MYTSTATSAASMRIRKYSFRQQQLKAWEKDFRAVLAAMKTTQVAQAN